MEFTRRGRPLLPGETPGTPAARRLAMALAVGVIAGCAPMDMRMDILTQRYPGFEFRWDGPRGADCKSAILPKERKLPEGCVAVGDIFVGDTGHSENCGKKRVENEVVSELCLLGADYGVVRVLKDPISSCHQVRAVAYRCPATEEAAAR
jgi:hypothetical protein